MAQQPMLETREETPTPGRETRAELVDTYGRRVDYLRVSVTDRCDLRCVYCMPAEGIPRKRRADILSYEQIATFASTAVQLGVHKVRLTGGEPLLRRNVGHLVGELARIPGLRDLCMTTNGTRLAPLAHTLKDRGLGRVNVSLDTLDPARYREITRGGDIQGALAGIDAALEARLTPVKINMVVIESTTSEDVAGMRRFCARKGIGLQTILQFTLYDRHDLARRFHADRPPRCGECSRLRLTADGFLKPCLFSEEEIKVDWGDPAASIRRAVAAKPESGSACRNRSMCQIGG